MLGDRKPGYVIILMRTTPYAPLMESSLSSAPSTNGCYIWGSLSFLAFSGTFCEHEYQHSYTHMFLLAKWFNFSYLCLLPMDPRLPFMSTILSVMTPITGTVGHRSLDGWFVISKLSQYIGYLYWVLIGKFVPAFSYQWTLLWEVWYVFGTGLKNFSFLPTPCTLGTMVRVEGVEPSLLYRKGIFIPHHVAMAAEAL